MKWVFHFPEDQTFSIKNNQYDKVAYNRLCKEFG